MRQVGRMSVMFSEMLLEGVASPELIQHGLTSDEERAACGNSQASVVVCKLVACTEIAGPGAHFAWPTNSLQLIFISSIWMKHSHLSVSTCCALQCPVLLAGCCM